MIGDGVIAASNVRFDTTTDRDGTFVRAVAASNLRVFTGGWRRTRLAAFRSLLRELSEVTDAGELAAVFGLFRSDLHDEPRSDLS